MTLQARYKTEKGLPWSDWGSMDSQYHDAENILAVALLQNNCELEPGEKIVKLSGVRKNGIIFQYRLRKGDK